MAGLTPARSYFTGHSQSRGAYVHMPGGTNTQTEGGEHPLLEVSLRTLEALPPQCHRTLERAAIPRRLSPKTLPPRIS